ncbi:hypothetical protein M8C21_004163, partial [Ambrosia artemisiifolia]
RLLPILIFTVHVPSLLNLSPCHVLQFNGSFRLHHPPYIAATPLIFGDPKVLMSSRRVQVKRYQQQWLGFGEGVAGGMKVFEKQWMDTISLT